MLLLCCCCCTIVGLDVCGCEQWYVGVTMAINNAWHILRLLVWEGLLSVCWCLLVRSDEYVLIPYMGILWVQNWDTAPIPTCTVPIQKMGAYH
jgi:hypothetical protein